MEQTPRPEVGRWLAQAREDVITAEANLETERFYAAALFAQQAAEKALKALIIHQTGQPAPKIHDLVGLSELAQVPAELKSKLAILGPAYLESRYPDIEEGVIPAESYTRTEVAELVKIAEGVVTWATSQT